MDCDVLIVNSIGPAFTGASVREAGIGGSELEVTQIAEALAAKGYSVVVANGVASEVESYGVRYIPFGSIPETQARALYIERGTTLDKVTNKIHADRIVIRATDIMCEFYEPHRSMLSSGQIPVVGVSEWQLKQFRDAIPGCQTICIPPMLGPTPETKKVRGRFVYASAPCKGLDATLRSWQALYSKHKPLMDKSGAHLLIAMPGYATGEAPPLSLYNGDACRMEYVGVPTVEDFRKLIASAEGLFYVNTMPETFCCTAAFAERSGTRTHIYCPLGMGGIPEALDDLTYVTTDEGKFEASFVHALTAGDTRTRQPQIQDRSPAALVGRWQEALGLTAPEALKPYVTQPAPVLPPEASMASEGPLNDLSAWKVDDSYFFGHFLGLLRSQLGVGGSELGLGMSLFSLAVSIRAANVVEIGRFKGFSTLALAGALRFNQIGWQEPKAAKQRPDVDYEKHEASLKPTLVSIDKFPMPEARKLIEDAGLSEIVTFIDADSKDVKLGGDAIDLLLIDGDHTYAGLKRDVARYVPLVRPGGYVVIHDYFGWYENGKNGSPIAKVCEELKALGVEQILIDTGYASFVIMRKAQTSGTHKVPTPVPARADGKPTVGLVIIAKNENPIVARAVQSCASWIDAVTVVVDAESTDGTAELCERLGAEVHVRPYAGSLAETRNDALRIAEQRTDYMLLVDADDMIEGPRPETLDRDLYDLYIHDANIRYPRGQLIRSKTGARFVGCQKGCKMNIPHEYLQAGPGATFGGIVEGLKYKRLGGIKGVSGWQDQAGFKSKYLRHARDLEKHHAEHPDDTRTIFYLGQSYRDAGEPEKAIPWYRKRAEIPDEEGWFSQLRVAELTLYLQMEKGIAGDPVEEYLKAYEMRRVRVDPLVALALYYRDDKRKQYERAYLYAKQAASLPLPKGENLFLAPDLYTWVASAELALAAHYTGRYEEATRVMQHVMTVCPEDQRQWAHETMAKISEAQRRAA